MPYKILHNYEAPVIKDPTGDLILEYPPCVVYPGLLIEVLEIVMMNVAGSRMAEDAKIVTFMATTKGYIPLDVFKVIAKHVEIKK